jgi:fatty acid desaturase
MDDYSNNYKALRFRLIEESGGRYKDFLKELSPDYKRVWIDIGFGYVMLALCLFVVTLFSGIWGLLVAAPLGAVFVGFWIAYLQLFLHAAAHFNLSPDRRKNDLLCDIFLSWQTGTSIKAYRPVHFEHHMHLGDTEDSERSYFNPLTWQFILEMLTGIHAIRVFLLRKAALNPEEDIQQHAGKGKSNAPLWRGVMAHLVLLAVLLAAGAWQSALAWVGGVGIFFPFFATLRQLLEHRSEMADRNTDYSRTPHGALARLFGDDRFSRIFGGAGFNRHLLHHWEPQICYTRLKDLEAFLSSTAAGPIIKERRTSYFKVFRDLCRHGNRTSRDSK